MLFSSGAIVETYGWGDSNHSWALSFSHMMVIGWARLVVAGHIFEMIPNGETGESLKNEVPNRMRGLLMGKR